MLIYKGVFDKVLIAITFFTRFFSFGSRKKNTLTPSPKPKRRGSAGNDADMENAGVAHHSYSTGNLRELDDKSSVMLRYCFITFLHYAL